MQSDDKSFMEAAGKEVDFRSKELLQVAPYEFFDVGRVSSLIKRGLDSTIFVVLGVIFSEVNNARTGTANRW